MKPIFPFKTLLSPLGYRGYKGFSLSLFSGQGKEGCWECSYAEFHLSVTLNHVFIPPVLTWVTVRAPPLTCGVPSSLSSHTSKPATWNSAMSELAGSSQTGHPPAVDTGWAMKFWSEADWILKECKCAPSLPAHICPERLGKSWAWPFHRRLSNCPIIQHSW